LTTAGAADLTSGAKDRLTSALETGTRFSSAPSDIPGPTNIAATKAAQKYRETLSVICSVYHFCRNLVQTKKGGQEAAL
jgi:hypothetical protein